ncbi:hypothetical protein DVH24_004845 [Malus domestica]|uniref:Uncharacterized protein n=1 Tax=Malus domestica TaxID=3750 RepID=A0A498IHD1_MALDO|nr:hypothetical protein DVH24_004845 [Malus domestica]
MIPAITRWDTSMIHKAIKDVLVEKIMFLLLNHKNNLQRENDIKKRAKEWKKTNVINNEQEKDARKDTVKDQSEKKANREDTTELDQNLNKNGQQTDEPKNININEA